MTLSLNTQGNNINLQPLYAEEVAKPSQSQIVTLLHLTPSGAALAQGASSIFVTDFSCSVAYDAQLYLAYPLKLSGINTSTDGSIDKATLTVGNVDPYIMAYLMNFNGLSKWRATFKFVYEKFLDLLYEFNPDGSVTTSNNDLADPLAYIEEEFLIDTYTASDQVISFQLDPIIDLSIQLPRRRFMTDSCYWRYKDPDTCKLVNGHAVDTETGTYVGCKKTLVECKRRGNQLNFGAFPGVSGTRRLFI